MWGNGRLQTLCPCPRPWSLEVETSQPPASAPRLVEDRDMKWNYHGRNRKPETTAFSLELGVKAGVTVTLPSATPHACLSCTPQGSVHLSQAFPEAHHLPGLLSTPTLRRLNSVRKQAEWVPAQANMRQVLTDENLTPFWMCPPCPQP